MITLLLIAALVAVLFLLGRESDGPQIPKIVDVIDVEEEDVVTFPEKASP